MITTKQREARKLGVGGSDIPIILGLSSYKTPYQLYLEKIGESVIEDEETDLQRRGKKLEAFVRSEFEHEFNVPVETPDTLIHPTIPYLRANVDGIIPSLNAIWEGKTSIPFNNREWEHNGNPVIPFRFIAQLTHYCAVANVDKAYISVFFGIHDLRHLLFERDLGLEEYVINKARAFWLCVEERNPPMPVNQLDLRLMFPTHDSSKVKTIAPVVAEHLTKLTETRFKIKALSELEEEHKFNVMQFMQEAECLIDESGKPLVSWKANKRGIRQFSVKGV